jgi:hypothetical protein
MSTTQRQIEDDNKDEDAFWRKMLLPEEDHLRMGKPWTGGYRWFRSCNVVPIERWRKKRDGSTKHAPKIE